MVFSWSCLVINVIIVIVFVVVIVEVVFPDARFDLFLDSGVDVFLYNLLEDGPDIVLDIVLDVVLMLSLMWLSILMLSFRAVNSKFLMGGKNL